MRRDYTEAEDAMIRKLVREGKSLQGVADAIGRTKGSIKWRMGLLGLSTQNDIARSYKSLEPMASKSDIVHLESHRKADKQFQRLLALAYMRGDFPKDCYPDGKVPLILTGG